MSWFDLREFEFGVVRVHGMDLVSGRSTENLDDFDKLVYARITREYWLSKEKFSDDTAH